MRLFPPLSSPFISCSPLFPRRQRLYDEQLEYHIDKETNTLKPLTYENMQTPLLMAFIKELLRVHAPLHSIMRKIILDYPVPASVGSPAAEPNASTSFKKQNEGVEYVIPKGEFVLAAPGFSQLDEAFWGPDAKEFNTDRWLGSGAQKVPGEEDEGEEDYGWGKISKGGKSACAFSLSLLLSLPWSVVLTLSPPLLDLPFGAGRHRCIGEQFANVQLGIIIATLVRENSWNLVGPFPGNDYTVRFISFSPLFSRDSSSTFFVSLLPFLLSPSHFHCPFSSSLRSHRP